MIEKALLWSVINECIFLSLPVIATLTLLPTYNVFIYFGDKVSQMMLSYVSNRKFYKMNQNKVIQMLSVWSMSIKRVDSFLHHWSSILGKVVDFHHLVVLQHHLDTVLLCSCFTNMARKERKERMKSIYSILYITNYINTGCPISLGPLCFLLLCQLLLYWNTKNGWVLKNSWNLLSDRHQNFKNRFRNSWDNWCQRWHLSFRSWHFTISSEAKK